MSTHLPSLEARIAAQERLQTILNARIEELGLDMQASFRDLAAYHERLETRLDKIDARFDKIEANMATIEANMATKADLAAMETRILSAFEQLIARLDK